MPSQHQLTISNDTKIISETAQKLAEQARIHCGLSGKDEFQIFLSLVEAINNAIVHGNLEVKSQLREEGVEYEDMILHRSQMSPFMDRRVKIHCEFTSEQATFQIQNEGPGFDASQVADPTEEENLSKPSGRGLLIMRAFFDEVEFTQSGRCLTLVKCVPAKETHPLEAHAELSRLHSTRLVATNH